MAIFAALWISAENPELSACIAGRISTNFNSGRDRCDMTCNARSLAIAVATSAILIAVSVRPIEAQQFRTTVEARTRMFPGIGPGVTALKRDSSRRYYLLAKPATAILIYDSNEKLVGQIPNANSQGTVIKYAVDIDLSPDGLLYVADRGANAVEIFKPDGTLVAKAPVNAPTSVAALSEGQFAVTSLTSDHLVQIRDQRGTLVRSFGDPSDIADDTGKSTMMEWGKIAGDSADGIYFALTSVPDPTLRKYDRFGYARYETTVPESVIEDASTAREDRFQLSVSLSHLSLSEQSVGSITFGSSRDLKFSAGVGTGLLGGMHYRGGYGRAQAGALQSDTAGSPLGAFGGGPLGGTVSGEISDQGPQLQLGMGRISGLRGGAQGRGGSGAPLSQTTTQGTTLRFDGSQSGEDVNFNDPELNGGFSLDDLEPGAAAEATNSPFGSASFQLQDAYNTDLASQNFGQGFGLPNDFVIGSLMDSFNTRSQFRPGGFGPGMHTGSPGPIDHPPGFAAGGSPMANTPHTGAEDAGRLGEEGFFRPRGRFGTGEAGVTASLRVNLGDLSSKQTDKPVVTAIGVDPATHDIWAGIGDTLVHFNETGDALEIYNLTMKSGTPLKPAAIVVEPDRFVIATDPWGIFEFARPDKAITTAPLQYNYNAIPQTTSAP